ncbi:class I SAM-dependent methyltransferase [Robbsia sp. Bb-Pol-6]|uniref:Class I SAM-dependent methyltransferase n=1 Tax=Robbsia betulipollinis TaxID=2981849 RepID=A0ABT3ZPN7_9BURK|nr:class I SAM-dependent methyltransferase [Robbsia betulipollinis]MCY0388511.1 class I SAM-dependent methyltransferase [Robbsia betulipollinis]
MSDRPIIDWSDWTDSAPGQYVLAWEQAQLDRVVGDIFGYRAIQLGMPQLDALRENRMPGRILMLDPASSVSLPYVLPQTRPGADRLTHAAAAHARTPPKLIRHTVVQGAPHAPPGRCTMWGDFAELPFENQSVDLLVMPHTLEFTREPHELLREAERVLVPEGRLVIVGFNSLSLWGVRQSIGRLTHRPFVPPDSDLIAFTRLKDWIKLLGFELSRGRFGCYRPPLGNPQWLERCGFMEAAGDRWWPIFGAVYLVTAVKRVRRMRLIGPAWKKKTVPVPALAPIGAPNTRNRK